MAQGFHSNIPTVTLPAAMPPNGAAAGDLGGNFPAPIVGGLQGRSVAATAPVDRQSLQWNQALTRWEPRYTSLRSVTATGAITIADDKIIVNNGATVVSLALPSPATCAGKCIAISRGSPSTGAITLTTPAGQIQNLNGTLTATTTIGAHSAAGAGVGHEFWSNGVNWYR